MTIYLKFKKWFSIAEAASYLEKELKTPLLKDDIYEYALEGTLPIWCKFQHQLAQEVTYAPPDNYYILPQAFDKSPLDTGKEVVGVEKPYGKFATILSVVDTPIMTQQTKPVFFFKLKGTNVVPLDEYYRLEIQKQPKLQHWIKTLQTGSKELFFSPDSIVVSDDCGTLWQLVTPILGHFQPVQDPPSEIELRIKSSDIQSFIDNAKKQNKEIGSLDIRRENSYLNIIGALVEILLDTKNDKGIPLYKTKAAIQAEIQDRFGNLKNLSERNMQNIFADAARSMKSPLDIN